MKKMYLVNIWRLPNPDISTGDLVLVKDHTSQTFIAKYKTDFHVIRVLGTKWK